MLLIQLPLPEGVVSKYGHSTIAVDLAPGLTEVTVFAGCPQYDPKKSLVDEVKLAETVIMSFGMFMITARYSGGVPWGSVTPPSLWAGSSTECY